MMTRTLLTAFAAAALIGSANAATFTWTGAGINVNDIDAADNWASGLVAASGSKIGTGPSTVGGAGDLISFDSETATALPTANIDIVRISSNGTQLSDFELLNGTLNFSRAENWARAGSTFTIGDDNLSTLAVANFAATINLARFGSTTYLVKSDGTLSFGSNFTWSTTDAVVRLQGGALNTNGNTISGMTDDAGEYVSFESAASTFTAGFGGSFANETDVTDAFGDSLRLGGALASDGSSLSYTDNGNGTFTVGVVPEPGSLALLGLGGLLVASRRRRRA